MTRSFSSVMRYFLVASTTLQSVLHGSSHALLLHPHTRRSHGIRATTVASRLLTRSNNYYHHAAYSTRFITSSSSSCIIRRGTSSSDDAVKSSSPPSLINGRSNNDTSTASFSTTTTTNNHTSANNNNTDTTSISTEGTKTNFDSTELLAIDPAVIELVEVEDAYSGVDNDDDDDNDDLLGGGSKQNLPQQQPKKKVKPSMDQLIQGIPFVSMFRGSANYIANHRNTLAVYHIPGGLLDLDDPTDFQDLMNDIALTWLLGMRIVLVAGCRHQIEKRIQRQTHLGLAITDTETLRVVKEEAGYVRFEIERQLARSLRIQGAGANAGGSPTPAARGPNVVHPGTASTTSHHHHHHMDGNVVSGNFYSAQPFGILNGVDYKYTGFVRKVEVNKIRQLHNNRDICLLTTLGVSPSGEVFNVNSESLAAFVAGAMNASKIIYFTEKDMELRHKIHGNKIQNLRKSDARNLLKYYDVKIHKRGFVTVGDDVKKKPKKQQIANDDKEEEEEGAKDGPAMETAAESVSHSELNKSAMAMLIKIGWSMQALEFGVKRAHIISPKFGAVLQELYTRDGSGTLISGDLYEGIRRADVNDVSGIYELIHPLVQVGKLVDRPKAIVEKDIDSYYVYTRDNHIVACGQLKIWDADENNNHSGNYAEIGCLVVNRDYRARGRGDAILGYLERLALVNGASTVFVLSTQTMEWFLERGFSEAGVPRLPQKRQETYNYERASKIYIKSISSSRDLDASELWWNR